MKLFRLLVSDLQCHLEAVCASDSDEDSEEDGGSLADEAHWETEDDPDPDLHDDPLLQLDMHVCSLVTSL